MPSQLSLTFISISALVVLTAILLNAASLSPFIWLQGASTTLTPYVNDSHTGVSYHGAVTNGIEHFQNIFYAEDTSGSNRFAPPIPYTPPPGTIIDATAAGAWSPQGVGAASLSFTSPITNVSENCLSLRVARPSGTNASAKLPVLVWIHGGGNALGSASDQLYQPDGLVRQAKLNGQIGQSVGASSISLHITSYQGAQGVPFQKAIMMSGASGTNFNIMSNLVANNTATVANSLGCITDDPDSQATLNCLRNASLERLIDVSVSLARKIRPPFGELAFSPSYDGDYIPERPSILLRKGIPIIASWTANDDAWYAQPSITDDTSVLATIQTFAPNLSHPSLQRLCSLYPVSDFTHLVRANEEATAQYYRAAQINRDIWFTCPVLDFTWQYTRHHGVAAPNVRLYVMNETKFTPIFQQIGVPHWRVSHLSDISYLFASNVTTAGGEDNNNNSNSAAYAQEDLSALLSGSAAAFAHTSNPSISPGRTFKDWPLAYQNRRQSEQAQLESEYPDELSLYVVGGDGHGSGRAATMMASSGMGSGGASSERERDLAWEKVVERCRFVNSIREEIGV